MHTKKNPLTVWKILAVNGFLLLYLEKSRCLFNYRACMAFQAVLCLIQGGDDGLPAFSALQEINGGRYLWQHGGKFKLALADIIPGLVYGHVADGLFLGRAVV